MEREMERKVLRVGYGVRPMLLLKEKFLLQYIRKYRERFMKEIKMKVSRNLESRFAKSG